MVPAIALRRPENFSRALHQAKERFTWIQVQLGLLTDYDALFPGRRIYDTKFLGLIAAFVVVVVEVLAVRKPLKIRTTLKMQTDLSALQVTPVPLLNVETTWPPLPTISPRCRPSIS